MLAGKPPLWAERQEALLSLIADFAGLDPAAVSASVPAKGAAALLQRLLLPSPKSRATLAQARTRPLPIKRGEEGWNVLGCPAFQSTPAGPRRRSQPIPGSRGLTCRRSTRRRARGCSRRPRLFCSQRRVAPCRALLLRITLSNAVVCLAVCRPRRRRRSSGASRAPRRSSRPAEPLGASTACSGAASAIPRSIARSLVMRPRPVLPRLAWPARAFGSRPLSITRRGASVLGLGQARWERTARGRERGVRAGHHSGVAGGGRIPVCEAARAPLDLRGVCRPAPQTRERRPCRRQPASHALSTMKPNSRPSSETESSASCRACLLR